MVFVCFPSDGWESLVWEVAGRSRCSLLLLRPLLLKAETGTLGLGPATGSRRIPALPIGPLGVSVSCLACPPALPSTTGEVDLKFEQLCPPQVNLPTALGGRCGTEERRRGAQPWSCVALFWVRITDLFWLFRSNLCVSASTCVQSHAAVTQDAWERVGHVLPLLLHSCIIRFAINTY